MLDKLVIVCYNTDTKKGNEVTTMRFEYAANWTYRSNYSDERHSEYKCFATESARDKFVADLLARHKKKEVTLLWVQTTDVKTWDTF